MIRRLVILISLVLFQQLFAASLTGIITDAETHAILEDVNISLVSQFGGTISKPSGNYTLNLDAPGDYQVLYSHIGYRNAVLTIHVNGNEQLTHNVELEPVSVNGNQVVITTNRYQKEVRDVSEPYTVVSDRLIQQQQPIDIAAALDTKPGLTISRDGMWGSQVAIRGLSRNNIVTLVDGNRIDTATDLAAGLSMIDVNDIERIEVIKGAASSLYGTGAVGGVINVITKDGWYSQTPYMQERITGGYATVNKQSMGQLALQAGAANWYLRASGMTRDAANVNTPQGELPNSQFNDQNISARAGVRFLENHEIKVNYQKYNATDVGIPGGAPLFPSTADVTYPKEERELLSVQYSMNVHQYGLDKWSLKYFQQDILRDVLNDPHTVNHVPAATGQPAKDINVLSVTPRATHNTHGVQLQTDWTAGNAHYLVAGVDFWQKDLESHREKNMRIDVLNANNEVVNSINQVIGERPLPESFYRSLGVFVQDEYTVNHRLSLSVGGRIDQIRVENEQVLNPDYQIVNGVRNDSPANQVVLWKAMQADDRSWSGNLGALYHLTNQLDFTLTLGKSFRSPYLEERYQYIDLGSLVKIGDPNLEPEQGNFTDAGIRLWGEKYTFVGNVFYNRMTNLVVEEPGTFEGRSALVKTNVGKAELYGFDAQASYTIAPVVELFGNIAWVHGQDTFTNTPLPLVPPLNGMLGISGTVKYGIGYQLYASMYAKQDRIADWEVETPGYTTYNLYIHSAPFDMLTITGQLFTGIENITDKSYRNHLSTNHGFVSAEPGRNFILRLQFSR